MNPSLPTEYHTTPVYFPILHSSHHSMTHLPLRRLLSTASTASSSLPPLSRGTTLYAPSSTHITSHLSALLSPVGVQLSTEKALRAVTHKSAVGNGTVFGKEREDVAVGGHGERLSFVG